MVSMVSMGGRPGRQAGQRERRPRALLRPRLRRAAPPRGLGEQCRGAGRAISYPSFLQKCICLCQQKRSKWTFCFFHTASKIKSFPPKHKWHVIVSFNDQFVAVNSRKYSYGIFIQHAIYCIFVPFCVFPLTICGGPPKRKMMKKYNGKKQNRCATFQSIRLWGNPFTCPPYYFPHSS